MAVCPICSTESIVADSSVGGEVCTSCGTVVDASGSLQSVVDASNSGTDGQTFLYNPTENGTHITLTRSHGLRTNNLKRNLKVCGGRVVCRIVSYISAVGHCCCEGCHFPRNQIHIPGDTYGLVRTFDSLMAEAGIEHVTYCVPRQELRHLVSRLCTLRYFERKLAEYVTSISNAFSLSVSQREQAIEFALRRAGQYRGYTVMAAVAVFVIMRNNGCCIDVPRICKVARVDTRHFLTCKKRITSPTVAGVADSAAAKAAPSTQITMVSRPPSLIASYGVEDMIEQILESADLVDVQEKREIHLRAVELIKIIESTMCYEGFDRSRIAHVILYFAWKAFHPSRLRMTFEQAQGAMCSPERRVVGDKRLIARVQKHLVELAKKLPYSVTGQNLSLHLDDIIRFYPVLAPPPKPDLPSQPLLRDYLQVGKEESSREEGKSDLLGEEDIDNDEIESYIRSDKEIRAIERLMKRAEKDKTSEESVLPTTAKQKKK